MPRTDVDEVYGLDGTVIRRTERVVSDEELDREAAPGRLRLAIPVLREWAADAEAIANQGGNVTQAQQKALFRRFGALCVHLADLLGRRI
jgi:hypothetical protein